MSQAQDLADASLHRVGAAAPPGPLLTNWVNAPSGTNHPATVPATLPARFYRLLKP